MSVPRTVLPNDIWPWHSGLRFLRFSGCSILQGSFLRRKLQRNSIVSLHTGSYRENSNRMQEPFHLLLKYFRVAEMHPIFPMIPPSADSNKFCRGSCKSAPSFLFLTTVSLQHLGESQTKETRRRGEKKYRERVRGSEVPLHQGSGSSAPVTRGTLGLGSVRAETCCSEHTQESACVARSWGDVA